MFRLPSRDALLGAAGIAAVALCALTTGALAEDADVARAGVGLGLGSLLVTVHLREQFAAGFEALGFNQQGRREIRHGEVRRAAEAARRGPGLIARRRSLKAGRFRPIALL